VDQICEKSEMEKVLGKFVREKGLVPTHAIVVCKKLSASEVTQFSIQSCQLIDESGVYRWVGIFSAIAALITLN